MSNEEFQKIVLEELGKLNEKIGNLEQGQASLMQGQEAIRKDLKAVIEQTADLTEFRVEINAKVDKLINDVRSIEIITSKNWNDIALLKAVK